MEKTIQLGHPAEPGQTIIRVVGQATVHLIYTTSQTWSGRSSCWTMGRWKWWKRECLCMYTCMYIYIQYYIIITIVISIIVIIVTIILIIIIIIINSSIIIVTIIIMIIIIIIIISIIIIIVIIIITYVYTHSYVYVGISDLIVQYKHTSYIQYMTCVHNSTCIYTHTHIYIYMVTPPPKIYLSHFLTVFSV